MRSPASSRAIARSLMLSGVALALLVACAGDNDDGDFDPAECVAQAGAPYEQTAAIKGTRVMVTSAHIDASMAGCRVLAKGGRAADAAVAVQAVLGVVEPFASGLAGGSLATYYDAASRTVRTIEGYSAAPTSIGQANTPWQAAGPEDLACRADVVLRPGVDQLASLQGPINASMRALGVPGTLRVLQQLHQFAGRLEWKALWGEAIDLAEAGAPMTPYMYSTLYSTGNLFDEEGAALPPGGVRAWSTLNAWGAFRCQYKDIRARYCDLTDSTGQRPLPVGTPIRNAELARTMQVVRDAGADAFYDPQGPVVTAILARSAEDKTNPDGSNNCDSSLPTYTGTLATGGTTSRPVEPSRIPSRLEAADFASYSANERTPLVGRAFGHTIHTHPPPSFGGAVVLESLALLERKNLSPTSHPWLGPDFLYLVSEASRIANADRRTIIGDPAYSNVDARLAAVLGTAHLDARAALINGRALTFGTSTTPFGGLATTTVPPYEATPPAAASTSAAAAVPPVGAAVEQRSATGPLAAAEREAEEINTTTNFAIIDAQGNALAVTSTINSHWGAHAEAAGMMLNNNMSNFSGTSLGSDVNGFASRKRPRSSTAPSIAFDAEGRLSLVWGAAGGGPIPDYIVKAFMGHRVYGMDLQAAINADNWSGQLSTSFHANVERGRPLAADDVLGTMRAAPYSYTSTTFAPNGLTSGSSGIGVQYDANGITYFGAADNRRHGGASGR